jgi:ribonuclease Z
MNFNLTILGCSSATPTKARHQSSQLLNIDNKYFLIDCGEGTQQQLRKYNFHIQKINNIFISHLHGDHYQGLIGLISTLHLLGRNEDLHIYGFKTPLKEIIDIQLKYSNTKLNYNIIYHDINPNKTECIYKDNIITVDNIVLQHSVPCCGFLFRENPKPRNIKKDFLRIEKIPFEVFDEIKAGKDYINPDGKI